MVARLLVTFILVGLSVDAVYGQNGAGPEMPIILEHADSVIGSGPLESSIRSFYGNVRFQQGNVTGRCDRAIHNAAANTIQLFGNVTVRQGALTMIAPEIRYSGSRYLATASKGLRVVQRGQTITAQKGEYAADSHIARFYGDVVMRDDTTRVWSDTMIVNRDVDTMFASGNVSGYDSTSNLRFEATVAHRDPVRGYYSLAGEARMWNWDEANDTLYVAADTIISQKPRAGLGRQIDAIGNASLVRAGTAARSGRITYSEVSSLLELRNKPYVWSDSMAFVASSITANLPDKQLESMQGIGGALLMSRVQGAEPVRYDQIAGNRLDLVFSKDTLRQINASGNAQSVTFKSEQAQQQGLAKVACDSLRANFDAGQLSEVYWLGGIAGEHHPEQLVLNKEQQFLLPGFLWRTDRPVFKKPRTRINR